MILQKLRNNPLPTALLVVLLYALWFIIPQFFIEIDPNKHGVTGIDETIGEWLHELIVGTAVIVIVTLLGWWKKIGFRSINPGGLKFLIAPFLLVLLLLGFAGFTDTQDAWFLGFTGPVQLLSLLVVMLMLGFVEESIFRGILFHGLETKFSPFVTVLVSSIIFGLFHYVNIIVGAGYYETSYQVVHAAAAGFLYASLRLRLGAIWPVMIFHGLWDFSLSLLQTVHHAKEVAEATSFSVIMAMSLVLPALLYGAFVYWRWSIWSSKSAASSKIQIQGKSKRFD